MFSESILCSVTCLEKTTLFLFEMFRYLNEKQYKTYSLYSGMLLAGLKPATFPFQP